MAFVFNPFTSTLDIVDSGILTVANVGSVPNSAGADITGTVLTLEPANGTNPGVLTSGTQTIGGNKTFTGTIAASNLSGTNTGDQTITLTGDVTGSGTGSFAATLATVNGSPGSFGSASTSLSATVNGKGLVTTLSSQSIQIAESQVTNLVSDLAGKQPTGSYITALTGDVTAAGPGSSAATVAKIQGITVSGTTGTGNVVFSASPTLVTPALGTPSALVGTNITGTATSFTASNVTTNANLTGVITSVGNATSIASQTGTGTKFVVDNNPTLVTPVIGAATGTSLSVSGQLTSTVATGTAPLVVSSTTQVANLNAATAGSATTATTATNTTNVATTATNSTNASFFPTFVASSSSSNQGIDTATGLSFNPSTNTLTTTTFSGALTGAASGNLAKATGDIDSTSFSAANNQFSVANVTGLLFANASVRSFQALVSVYVNATSSLYETFTLTGIQRGADWQMSQVSVGDASGFVFSITTLGQVQYTNSNYTGFTVATVKFRAITTAV